MQLEILDIFHRLFFITMQIVGPILIISMAVGILISIIQAATQIHEQTLTFVPKLLVIGIILVISGNTMLTHMQEFLMEIMELL